MRVLVDPEGNLEFSGLAPICAETLARLPETLRSQDPEVRERLLPKTYEDAEDAEQWRRYAVPELEHLFAGRIELIEKDLSSLREQGEIEFSLRIPVQHRFAWLSGLNAARLTMFIREGFDADDMEAEPGAGDDPERELALWRIHFLALMQETLLEAGGFVDQEADPDEDPDEEHPDDEV